MLVLFKIFVDVFLVVFYYHLSEKIMFYCLGVEGYLVNTNVVQSDVGYRCIGLSDLSKPK